MKARYGSFILIVLGAVTLQLAYVNCGGFKQDYKLDAATEAVLNSSAFGELMTDFPLGDATTTADGVTQVRRVYGIDTEIPIAPNPEPTPTPAPQCQPRNVTFDGMVERIKATGDYKTNRAVKHTEGCEVSLMKFAANAVDANGKTVKAIQNNGKAVVDMYCKLKNDGLVQVILNQFNANKIRNGATARTHICKSGTDPKSCVPTHANYLFSFEYGKYGKTKGGNTTFTTDKYDAMDIISSIQLSDTQIVPIESCHDVGLYSPLVIEKKFGAGIKTLDPKSHHTYFDITGKGKKDRISCVTGGAFLALPDGAGEINSVHQLFGDRTVGPDGKKAANGFEALGKWDKKALGHGYGAITKDDEIFSKLRLWEDRNCNGIAERAEVDGLEAYDIEAIRWIDHVEMRDVDAYGNATLQRNVAFTADKGHLRVFDLWFMLGY